MSPTISTSELVQHLSDKDLILLDASPASTIDGESSEHASQTIPGARFYDLKANFSDKNSPFPNTIPSPDQFEKECQKLGVNKTSKIVVFDNLGVYSSPRVWWLFKVMGHENISVLDGGLPSWIKTGNKTSDSYSKPNQLGDFESSFNDDLVIKYEDILSNLNTPQFCVMDARSEGRFNGTAPEPRKHLKSGHISGSVNIPFEAVLADGKFKSSVELRALFADKFPSEKELVFSCGSGLTACIIMLAYEIAFQKSRKIYDGSWTEWAELQGLFTDLS